jgi:alkylhydroperoxidase/carboxymuconolactone decarboxylase family protein YurZ
MQLPREMYMGGGISSLSYPSYPSYGYADGGITTLPNYMGGGYIDKYGRQRYGFGKLVKKITKPIAKVLDKIVPNEIKPALPFIAAAVPLFGPALAASAFGMTPQAYAAIAPYVQGGASAFSQLSQEGAAERGLNPVSLGLSALQGYLAAPGASEALRSGQVLGVDELGQAITRGSPGIMETLQTNYPGLDFSTSNLTGQGAQYGIGVGPPPETSFLTGAQNFATEAATKGADVFKAGQEADSIFSKEFLTAAAPGQVGAAGELAYNAALDAQKKYEQEMLAMGNLASANKQQQIDYIRRAMVSAGFTEDEIGSALTRSGFASGGRVAYGLGSLVMKNARSIKNKVLDFLSKMTDDIKIKPQTDYADDSGASFDLNIYPRTKKGKETLVK